MKSGPRPPFPVSTLMRCSSRVGQKGVGAGVRQAWVSLSGSVLLSCGT